MGAQSVIEHALNQGAGPACMRPGMGTSAAPARSLGVSLGKASDTRPLTRPVLILGATDGMGGGRESLPRPVGTVARRMRGAVGRSEAAAVVADALSIPHRDHFADSADGWETYSVRAVTGLRLLCPVDHSDGGFVESEVV